MSKKSPVKKRAMAEVASGLTLHGLRFPGLFDLIHFT
jgi:hypothetical protein